MDGLGNDFVIIDRSGPGYRSLSSFSAEVDSDATACFRSFPGATGAAKIQKKELTPDVLLKISPCQFTNPKKLLRLLREYKLPAHATAIELMLALLNFCMSNEGSNVDEVKSFVDGVVRCFRFKSDQYHLTEVDRFLKLLSL